jgi:hypothetical protein
MRLSAYCYWQIRCASADCGIEDAKYMNEMAMPKCKERGCPFPAIFGERCRQHTMDGMAECSVVSSSVPTMMEWAIASNDEGVGRGARLPIYCRIGHHDEFYTQ